MIPITFSAMSPRSKPFAGCSDRCSSICGDGDVDDEDEDEADDRRADESTPFDDKEDDEIRAFLLDFVAVVVVAAAAVPDIRPSFL